MSSEANLFKGYGKYFSLTEITKQYNRPGEQHMIAHDIITVLHWSVLLSAITLIYLCKCMFEELCVCVCVLCVRGWGDVLHKTQYEPFMKGKREE